MTIYFIGGQLDSLNNAGIAETDDTGFGDFDGSFSRGSTRVSFDSGGAAWAETPEWSAVQELWLHYYVAEQGAALDAAAVSFMDGVDTVFKLHRDSGAWKLSYLSGVATFTQAGTDVPRVQPSHVDIHWKSGASGEVAFYINGILQMEATGLTMTYAPDVTKIRFGELNSRNIVSQIIMADEPTIGWRVGQSYMTSNGANTAWTGDYTSVDEALLNEADYIYSGSADQIETYGHTLVPSLTGYNPRAVAVSARARRGGSGPQNIQLAIRSGSTNYFSGTKSLDLGYSAVQHVWETNPDTSLPWTVSQVAAAQPGVKSIT